MVLRNKILFDRIKKVPSTSYFGDKEVSKEKGRGKVGDRHCCSSPYDDLKSSWESKAKETYKGDYKMIKTLITS